MTDAGAAARQISTDELMALAQEIAALARAGLPVESGLTAVQRDLPRRLERTSSQITARLNQGDSLAQALGAVNSPMSPVLVAVVEVGMRSGRLPVALEQLVELNKLHREVRWQSLVALIYPLIVLVLAVLVTGMFASVLLPRLAEGFASFRLAIDRGSQLALDLRAVPWWGWLAMCGVALLIGLLVALAALAIQAQAWSAAGARSAGLPLYGRMFSDALTAHFAGMLALLIEHKVPLPAALRLAGEATKSRALAVQARTASERLERGESTAQAMQEMKGLPASFVWTVAAGETQGTLSGVLRRAAESHRQRAAWRAEALRTVLPVVLIVSLAGLATLACVLVLFYPWAMILRQLGDMAAL